MAMWGEGMGRRTFLHECFSTTATTPGGVGAPWEKQPEGHAPTPSQLRSATRLDRGQADNSGK